jgi:NAD(P) transhydrogenase
MVLETEFVVIATGTRPNRPPEVPFDDQCIFDSDTILSLPCIPRSLAVLGAGVIGVEYAATFAALGIEVTLLDTRTELLPYLDREIAGILERELRHLGIAIIHDDKHETIQRLDGDPPLVRCTTAGGLRIEAEAMLYCVGRDGNSANLGLENAGITPSSRGLISVNENYQTHQPNIYAAGDIIGYPALASTSMEQGRQAVRHAFDLSGHAARTDHLPFAIYSIPEVSYIGETEETLTTAERDYVVGRGLYAMNPRGQIAGDTGGQLKLLFAADSMELLGVHIVGLSASELIHTGQALLESRATADRIAETLYNYPTLSDLYRHAALEAIVAARRRLS